jgi:hypothetical protein
MVDLTLLKEKFATTNDRLKEIFTCERPSNFEQLEKEKQEKIESDLKIRCRMEDLIFARLTEAVTFNLKNHTIYSAVDVAWDSTPIMKGVLPLMLYAQGKLDKKACATSLEAAGFGDKYVTKDEKGGVKDIDLPKFYECNVNLIRSILTRRLAAQANKYSNLWPYYKYDSRGFSQVEKLRADLVSQRMDVMADQFDHKHHEVQVVREMLMYAQVIDFVRAAWEKEQQARKKKQAPGLETSEKDFDVVTVKEGVTFINPHPSRTFWDTAYPLASLNSDTGCEFVGYWDVVRYRDINLNTQYWNRDKISYSSNTAGLFTTYSQYFTQYYTTIVPPKDAEDHAAGNDRKNSIGIYGSELLDTSMITANYFMKLKPKDWGFGDYPYDVWVRFVLAGEKTVLFAEYLPSTPGAVASHNSNDSRLINISFAHELMGYQDQLTNLFTHLLMCLSSDHVKFLVIDTGLATPEQVTSMRKQIKGSASHPGTYVLEIDRAKMAELGVSDPKNVVTLVETRSMAIDTIFRAIGQLIQMVERMAALSPQEQGQPAPREISATETNLIAGTTESVYGYISDSIDEYRAAKKRILYESWMIMGEDKFRLPVVGRYPKAVIEAAGLKAEGDAYDAGAQGDAAKYTVTGEKYALEHDYIFTSRDGAERPVNTQSANVLVQLIQTVFSIPAVTQAIRKEQFYEMVNEVFRQSGAGFDLKLELQPGDDPMLGPDPNEIFKQLQGALDGLTKASESNKEQIEQMKIAIEPLLRMVPQPMQQAA